MMRLNAGFLFLGWLALQTSCWGFDRPNFVIIFTDDQGYNDLGCFGSPDIRTPNIDRMASEGVRLTSFYSGASVCTPSRAALLTGCYPERVGNLGVLFPDSDRGLNPEETTIAEMLRQQGYVTACIGKWHLGHHQAFLPTEHGFDEYFGIPYSNDMGVDGSMELAENVKLRNGQTVEDFRATSLRSPPLVRDKLVIEWPADQTQLTRRYTEETTRFITEHANEPFFVYLPHTMPHIPLYVSDQFRGTSNAGLYGDAVEEIDWSVGEILKTLKELQIDDRTLIIYTSDNGPWNLKGNETDKVKGNMNRRIGGSADPLRGHKFSKWEGGMRVPCVMRWPGRIPSRQTCDEIAATIDILPTIAEWSGATVSADRDIDGKSIVPLLEGQANAKSPHEAYFYRTNAVRSGKWKYFSQNRQLFDLEADISESTNVAARYPNVAGRLEKLLEDHQADMTANGRPPAYIKRPAHPLIGLDGWIVQSGRWNLREGGNLRQNSDWSDAEVVSPKLDAVPEVIELEAKLLNATGEFGLALFDVNHEACISLSLGAENNTRHVLKATRGNQTTVIVGSIDGTQWHHIKLNISNNNVTASLNDKRLGELKLADGIHVDQIALTGSRSKAEYRNLKVTGPNKNILLEFPKASAQ